jgi:hypothetical protein
MTASSTTIVGRVVLGICAGIGIAGGAAMVLKAVIYFGADRYPDELTDYQNLLFGGLIALAIFVAGAFRAHLVVRVVAGIGAAFAAFIGSQVVASIGSQVADRGGPQGNLEDAIDGFLWLVACVFIIVVIAMRRWPVRQRHASAPTAD